MFFWIGELFLFSFQDHLRTARYIHHNSWSRFFSRIFWTMAVFLVQLFIRLAFYWYFESKFCTISTFTRNQSLILLSMSDNNLFLIVLSSIEYTTLSTSDSSFLKTRLMLLLFINSFHRLMNCCSFNSFEMFSIEFVIV